MFTENSRYAGLKTLEIQFPDGQIVTAIKLRHLPVIPGNPYLVQPGDRLDLVAYQQYKQPLRFWHIADANTELEAKDLVQTTNQTITLPET